MTDLTRKSKFNEKKTVSVAAAELSHEDVSGTALQELFNLPPNALITAAHTIVHEAGQTSLTVDLGFAGGDELGDAVDIDDVGPEGGVLTTAIDTGTGKNVTAKFSADPTAGRFTFIVEFIEYTLGNGTLMDYS